MDQEQAGPGSTARSKAVSQLHSVHCLCISWPGCISRRMGMLAADLGGEAQRLLKDLPGHSGPINGAIGKRGLAKCPPAALLT